MARSHIMITISAPGLSSKPAGEPNIDAAQVKLSQHPAEALMSFRVDACVNPAGLLDWPWSSGTQSIPRRVRCAHTEYTGTAEYSTRSAHCGHVLRTDDGQRGRMAYNPPATLAMWSPSGRARNRRFLLFLSSPTFRSCRIRCCN